MIISCLHCQARLNLPEYVEGKQVRCPICRRVFLADKQAIKEGVQAGSPESASVTPRALRCCYGLVFYGPMLTFIGIGARSLFAFGSRGLIVTAVVMNFIVFLIISCWFVSHAVLGTWLPITLLMGTTIATSSLCGVTNLSAAIMAIRVLTFREAADAYAARVMYND